MAPHVRGGPVCYHRFPHTHWRRAEISDGLAGTAESASCRPSERPEEAGPSWEGSIPPWAVPALGTVQSWVDTGCSPASGECIQNFPGTKKKVNRRDGEHSPYGCLPSCVRPKEGTRGSLSGHTDAARETQPQARRVLHACAGRWARPQMYTGCSWAVSSLYMAAGIVFM